MKDEPRIPRYVKVVACIIALGIVTFSLLTWGIIQQRAHDCQGRVDGREDGRAVWLYLVARDPERADDPDVVEFVEFLNDRLPPLHCVGGSAVPITEGD